MFKRGDAVLARASHAVGAGSCGPCWLRGAQDPEEAVRGLRGTSPGPLGRIDGLWGKEQVSAAGSWADQGYGTVVGSEQGSDGVDGVWPVDVESWMNMPGPSTQARRTTAGLTGRLHARRHVPYRGEFYDECVYRQPRSGRSRAGPVRRLRV